MQETNRPEGFVRVSRALAELGHPHEPVYLEVSARTCQEAADALGVAVGQIAKSVIFRRKADGSALLVVTSGDRRVDEKKVAALTGPLGRADADFVKAKSGTNRNDQVQFALLQAMQRPPTQPEIDRGVALIRSLENDRGLSREQALHYFCLLALNLNEFVTVD